jgi:hypothetical protein
MGTADMHRVITAGETMALMGPPGPGRLRHATSLALSSAVLRAMWRSAWHGSEFPRVGSACLVTMSLASSF